MKKAKLWLSGLAVLVVLTTCTSGAMAYSWIDDFTGPAGSPLDAAWNPLEIGQLSGDGYAMREASGATYRATGKSAADVVLEFTFKTVGTVGGHTALIGLNDTEVPGNYTQVEIRTVAGTGDDEMKFTYQRDGTYSTMKTVAITQDTLYDVRFTACTTASWWISEYKEHSSDTWISGGGSTYVSGVDRVLLAFYKGSEVRVDKIAIVPEPVTLGMLAAADGGVLASASATTAAVVYVVHVLLFI